MISKDVGSFQLQTTENQKNIKECQTNVKKKCQRKQPMDIGQVHRTKGKICVYVLELEGDQENESYYWLPQN